MPGDLGFGDTLGEQAECRCQGRSSGWHQLSLVARGVREGERCLDDELALDTDAAVWGVICEADPDLVVDGRACDTGADQLRTYPHRSPAAAMPCVDGKPTIGSVGPRAALPRAARVTEADLDVGGHTEAAMSSHLSALIPGQ